MAFGREGGVDGRRHEKDRCTRRIVKGLHNVGNTCFFNSIIQNLLAVGLLRDHFMKPAQFPEGPITSALRKLYVETSTEGSKQVDDADSEHTWWNEGNKTVNPKVLFSAICAEVPQFRGFRQQDSHELLRCLLDNLHTEELLNLSNSESTNPGDGEAAKANTDESSNQMNNTTFMNRVFQGQLRSTVCCSKCGYHSETYEPFYDLSLPIPNELEPTKFSRPQHKSPQSSKVMSATEIHDLLYEDLPDAAENVRGIENHFVEDSTAKSDFGLLGCSGSPLPDKEMDSVTSKELEVTKVSAELNTDDALAKPLGTSVSSIIGIDPIDDIFDKEKTSVVVGESENNENGLFMGVPVTTETGEEEAAIPMSIDACLVEFTRPELLRGANGWKCPNCASELVNGSDNQENMTAKEDQSMGFNGMLKAESLQNISDSIMDENPAKKSKKTELEVSTSARCLENSGTKADEFQEHSGCVTGSGVGINDNACQQTQVLCSLNDIDNVQPSNQEGHKMIKGFAGEDTVPVHDSSAQRDSCGHRLGHSNENERILGDKDSSEIDGINHAEGPASTGWEEGKRPASTGWEEGERPASTGWEEGGTIHANWGEWPASTGWEEGGTISSNWGERPAYTGWEEGDTTHANWGERPASTGWEEGDTTHANWGERPASTGWEESGTISSNWGERPASTGWEDGGTISSNWGERPVSTGWEEGGKVYANWAEFPESIGWEEDGTIYANWGERDLEPQKLSSSGEGHRPKKRKSRTSEHEAISDSIIQEATKTYLISNAPPVLTIHLKRFKHDSFGSLCKWNDHVAFHERFDLRPYLDPRCHDKDNCIYRLIGVVEHEGTMEFGHYVAYVRCDQDDSVFQWFYASDSCVKEVSLREVLESTAYILFYEKCEL